MATIHSDRELKLVLEPLSPERQRRIGAMFIESALDLCDDPRVQRAVEVAMDPASSEKEREEAFHAAKSYVVHSYTECGQDTDWSQQASHFVGVAAACLLSDEAPGDGKNRAWKAAMQVRNGRNCALMVHEGDDEIDDEPERQYRIASDFVRGLS